jgi:hypothetical protein
MSMPAASVLFIALLLLALSGCGGGGGSDSASEPTTPSRQSAEGGEKSIEGFGSEAEGTDRNAILAAEQSYFTAVSSKGYAMACSHLASSVKRSMAELSAGRRRANCAAVLPALLAPQAYATMRQQARGAVKRVRIEGNRAFVVFHAPGARLYQMPLVSEDDDWKVGLLTSAVLVPSRSTLRG